MRKLLLLCFCALGFNALAQTTGKIVDGTNGESIPYANIQLSGGESLVSNAEGFFTISEASDKESTTIVVSYIGYAPVQLTVGELRSKQLKIALQPAMYELDEVKVAKLPSPQAIMAAVKRNLTNNYGTKEAATESKIFMRQSNSFAPKTLDVEISESTGFSKSALKSFNGEINKFTSRLVSSPPREYTDMLCNYYTASGKTALSHKLNVVKATKLKDESRAVSLEGLQKNATELLLRHLDTTKYYRIKSGWFGSHDTISLKKGFKSSKNKAPVSEIKMAKSRITSFSSENNVLSANFDFIQEPEIYEYSYEGAVFLNDGNFAYVLTFKPDRSRAKYTGKLYISESDFAIVRADYQLAEGKKVSGMNMKFLLGVKVSENYRTGTMIYRQKDSGNGYYLQYASREDGQYIYLNRPLKFIELAKTDKDVVAFDFKIEGNMFDKTEYLSLSNTAITSAEFDNSNETDFKYQLIKQYDPKIWKHYGAIEPLQEMKRFKVGDEMP